MQYLFLHTTYLKFSSFGPPLSCWCLIVALLFFLTPPRRRPAPDPPRPPRPGAPSSHHLTLLFLGRASLSITTSPVPHQRAPWPWVPRTSPFVAADLVSKVSLGGRRQAGGGLHRWLLLVGELFDKWRYELLGDLVSEVSLGGRRQAEGGQWLS